MISCAILTIPGAVLLNDAYKNDAFPIALAMMVVGGVGFLYEFVRSFYEGSQPPEKKPPTF
jgi:hypothetical protein